MIAKTTSSPRFLPLAAYLAAGTDGRHPERVEWIAGRRLAIVDLTVAPVIMEATAYQSVRVERPCYHVMVSFDVRDMPTRPQMEEVADRLLAGLGLSEHQALLVAHNDRPCLHIHMMVNRVHPRTGVAWERWKDRHVIEAVLREAERDFGMRAVPGRLSPALDQVHALPTARAPDLTWGERRLAGRTGQVPLLDRARDALAECRDARSWGELEAVLAARGLTIARTAKGIVITDGRTRVKASRVAPDLGLPRLETRLGDRLPEASAPTGVDRIGVLVRLLANDRTIEHTARDTAVALQRARAELTAVQVSGRQTRVLMDQLIRDFDHVYAVPEAARPAFVEVVRLDGAVRACRLLADTPEQFGALRAAVTQHASPIHARRRPVNAHETALPISLLARQAMQAAERTAALLSEGEARVNVESASTAARIARQTLDHHRASHPEPRKMREQLGLEVNQLNPANMQLLRRTLTSAEIAEVRSIAAAVRERHNPHDRSLG